MSAGECACARACAVLLVALLSASRRRVLGRPRERVPPRPDNLPRVYFCTTILPRYSCSTYPLVHLRAFFLKNVHPCNDFSHTGATQHVNMPAPRCEVSNLKCCLYALQQSLT